MDNSLPKVPFLEEVTSHFLMTWMAFWEVDHLVHEFSLLETLIDQEIVLLMHGSVTPLARPLENLEASPKSGRIPGVPIDVRREIAVSVMHTN